MATDKEKLKEVLKRLKTAAVPNEQEHYREYWLEIETRCDNATDAVCDYDQFIKQLIEYIEG